MKCQLIQQFVAVILLITEVSLERRFDDCKVYSLHVKTMEQYNFLVEKEYKSYDFWESPTLGQTADVMIETDEEEEFLQTMDRYGIERTVKIENLQTLIDLQFPISVPKSGYGWERYHSLDEIYSFLDEQLRRFPTILKPFTVGYSYEGREIRGVKLSRNEGNKAILIDATIHAREWISTPAATWLLKELLSSDEPEVMNMSSNIDWYFIPVVNPDGFVFSREVNRSWRKSRTPHDPVCFGVDLNRNFDYFWNTQASSNDPCSHVYAGPTPFSEKESIAYKDFFEANKEHIVAHFAFHSPGQYILAPYGYSRRHADNHDELMQIGKAAADAIRQRNGSDYLYGTTAQVLRLDSGTVRDWLKGVHNIRSTYTIEMRDIRGGPYGFLVPPDQILANALDIFDAMKAAVRTFRELNFF